MTIKRLLTQIRLYMCLGNGYKRAKYARKRGMYAEIGQGSTIPSALPLYPQLVKIHNNVIIHRSAKLITHDVVNSFLMNIPGTSRFKNGESLCPIEVFDNVFIGEDSIICGNVRIGLNAFINAGSVVMGDVPPNSVVEGVPAKVIGDFDKFVKLRAIKDRAAHYEFQRSGKESIDEKTIEMAWEKFDSKKNRREA